MDFPGGSDGKESTCNAGDLDPILGLGRSLGGGNGNPLQYYSLENPQGQRSLAGYSPWGLRVRHDGATKYSTVHIYEIWKDGTDGPIFREAVDMQPYKETCGHSGANWRVAWKHMHY